MTTPTLAEALRLAIRFHETYERLAPSFGYETRPDTREFEPNSKNGCLMVAVCGELLPSLAAHDAQPAPVAAVQAVPAAWRCYHCNESFTDHAAAQEHFGRSEYQQPACQIDVAEYRRMEEANRRHCEEDTDLHRLVARMESDHQQALRREEEAGYAKGLRDAAAHPSAQAAQRDELLIQLNGMIDVAERFARHMHKRGDTDERDVIQRAINAARASIEGAAKP